MQQSPLFTVPARALLSVLRRSTCAPLSNVDLTSALTPAPPRTVTVLVDVATLLVPLTLPVELSGS